MKGKNPPRFARRVLERALPTDVRSEVLGDLTEVYGLRYESHGALRAGLWYCREALSFSTRFLWERMRESGLLSAKTSLLDFKLGLRMLLKYPGLTFVGGLAMSVGIALTAGFFEFSDNFISPELPFDEGDRIVSLYNWDVTTSTPELHALHDLQIWRDELESIEEIGASNSFSRNLITDDGRSVPVRGAEMSASSFRIARVPPLLGRHLDDGDEEEGAPAVVVIGFDLWSTRFGGDPTIVGREIRLGATAATVVGVMPDGFAFPINESIWVPLRLDPLRHPRLEGPTIRVFGRLQAGVALEEAQAELSAIGQRTARDFPATNQHLRPRVTPYTETSGEMAAWKFRVARAMIVFVLLIACANVGILVFARSATRESEIAVRSALGASRGRIVLQLFVESLVLASVAAALGLALASWAIHMTFALLRDSGFSMPFWWHDQLAWSTVGYVVVFTLLAAAMAGVLPALKVTGPGRSSGLRLKAAGGSSLRFGNVSTSIIVIQVALSVGLLTMAIGEMPKILSEPGETDLPAEEYLSVRLQMDAEAPQVGSLESEPAEFFERFWVVQEELERRLLAEPIVKGVARTSVPPGGNIPRRFIDVEDSPISPSSPAGHVVRVASVDVDFFDVMSAPLLAGRGFDLADAAPAGNPDSRVVIVNQSFVRQLLGDQSAIGRRLRYATASDEEPGPWHEIVGVVGDLGMSPDDASNGAELYEPFRATTSPVYLAIHVEANARGFAPRLRSIGLAVDPTLRLERVTTLEQVIGTMQVMVRLVAAAVALITAAALILSLSGIYSLMSFIVSQRTREIGIRAALGAHPRDIVAAILSRAALQLGLGVACGVGLAFLLNAGGVRNGGVGLLVAVSVLMTGMGLIACAVPARRALQIEPTEALRQGS